MKFKIWPLLCCLFIGAFSPATHAQSVTASGWAAYGGDAGGQRYSAARQITVKNVATLEPVWTYHTGALASKRSGYRSAAFEATPILFHGTLYFATPFDEIVALDAVTGKKRWSYDPILRPVPEGGLVTSRGVAIWEGPPGTTGPCHDRVLVGTLDARLIEVDAADGHPCRDFGKNGQVDVMENWGKPRGLGITITSPPTVIGDVVVVGSSISDNFAVTMASGVVRAYNVVSGKPVWNWEPIPWASRQKIPTGAANAWSIISADPALGLVYIPTSSPSPDHYGGLRPGANADSDSVVALEAQTGRKVWAFQLVHHDLWDYDTAAQPLLFTFHETIPAIAVTNKTGMVYVLDRRTGVPLYPVEEKPVPASNVPGEQASPTQPFSSLPALGPLRLPDTCRQNFARLRYDGMFTPPSFEGTLELPGRLGGVNWGSAAFDPETGIYYAANNRAPFEVRLVRRDWKRYITWTSFVDQIYFLPFARWPVFTVALVLAILGMFGRRVWRPLAYGGVLGAILLSAGVLQKGWMLYVHIRRMNQPFHFAIFGVDDSPMLDTPYSLSNTPIEGQGCRTLSPSAITAVNLQTGKRVWERPQESIELGGPIVTAGGLVFAAGVREPYLRAFNKSTGEELWKGKLPAPAQATPMTYSTDGRQFVVIAAGGHGLFETPQGDSLVAYALPK
jgi:quinoprotein glucose dehydrogenase